MFKIMKWGLAGGVVVVVAGLVFFGTDIFSYAFTSGKMLKNSLEDSIPVELKIQRARDLMEDLIPEMHANLKLVAKEEVEVATLEKEISRERERVALEREKIRKMRKDLDVLPVSYSEARNGAVKRQFQLEEMAQRFERFRTAELLLAGREKLLENRRKSLHAAIQQLERTRLARVELAAQIEALEGQFILLQAQQSSSKLSLNNTKLAQTERLLGDLKKQLQIAQRVLERESELTEAIPVSTVTVENLAEQIDDHFRHEAHQDDLIPESMH